MSIPIRIEAKSDPALAAKAISGPLGFGQKFADAMVVGHHQADKGWHDVAIVPYGPLPISPAAKALHYGLQVFEGLKAYLWEGGEVALFRPELNFERLNNSARRLRMPEVPITLQREATDLLVDLVRAWVPGGEGASLYLRPILIADDPALGVMPGRTHLYAVLAAPAGPYFAKGFEAISVRVEMEQKRAARGGIGATKTGGNYAAGMDAKARARADGFDEVLFLDAVEGRFLEELSGMNVFVVEEGRRLVTPPLGGTILAGITRRSILELAGHMELEAVERPVAIDELTDALAKGRVTEMMAVGTAAVVTPIGELTLEGEAHRVGDGTAGPVAKRILRTLTGIQQGRLPDEHGWMHCVPRRKKRVAQPALAVS